MNLMFHLKLYTIMLVSFLAVDMVWLVGVARGFYQRQLGYLLSPRPNWYAAIAFYMVFIVGMLVFVVQPNLTSGTFRRTLLLGAFFGLVTYATYDLTNMATVKDWPWLVSVVDMIWGMVLTATICGIGYTAARWLQ